MARCGAVVALRGEGRSGRPFNSTSRRLPLRFHDLAKKGCGAIAKRQNEIAELMPGIRHRDWLGARWNDVAANITANASTAIPSREFPPHDHQAGATNRQPNPNLEPDLLYVLQSGRPPV